jgi:hypothetical protein
VHAVTPFARRFKEQLFPGYLKQILALDGRIVPADQVNFHMLGKPILLDDVGAGRTLDSVTMTRGGLEATDRLLTLNLPNIRLIHGKGVDVDVQDDRVVAVSYRPHGQTALEQLEAAFVADCTGTSRMGVKWLKRHGYQSPRVSSYTAHVRANVFEFPVSLNTSAWRPRNSCGAQLSEEQWRSLPLPRDPDDCSWVRTLRSCPCQD